MKEFKKILFPVDLSESSEKILPYVQAVAKKFEAKIHILFAARVFEYFTSIYVPHPSINKFEKEIIDYFCRAGHPPDLTQRTCAGSPFHLLK
jgi:nucleotide-binding universal stress UspA family protein